MKTKNDLLICDDWKDYTLLDSGHGMKLERYGSQTVIRPDAQAFWNPTRPIEDWRADAHFQTKSEEDDRGNWQVLSKKATEVWPMRWKNLELEARRTAFRHMGVFPEHSVHWAFAQEQIKKRHGGRILNLFGYTGMASLACAEAGADEVVHLDASPKSNGYGKINQELSGLQDRKIRWITDDAMKFTAREIRRGNTYDGIILDPPKFGRGPKNETWKFDENLQDLFANVRALLSDRPLFVITTSYAVRLSYLALAQTLGDHLKDLGGTLQSGEMAIAQKGGERLLPTALYSRWSAD